MLFQEKKSALVRLSDCLKFGVGNCFNTTTEVIKAFEKHSQSVAQMREIALSIERGSISYEQGEASLREASSNIPKDEALQTASLQGRLHAESLSVLLNTCFTLESYINSLGYFLLKEKDFLGLVSSGHDVTAEIITDAIEKMSTISKWDTLGSLNKGAGFNKSKAPYQNLKVLFNFRNDIVHDKVADYSDGKEDKRYNKKLPDPVFGLLDLTHVVFAADTYWSMVSEIHKLLGTDSAEFHRHYNLSPWFNDDFETQVRQTCNDFIRVTG